MKNTLFLVFLLLILEITSIKAQTIKYITPTGSGNLSGTSWANASPNIQDMIDTALPGTQIWVKGGTYLPTKDPFGNSNPTDPRDKTFYMKEGVSLFGSFAGNETAISQRDANVMIANPTILSGNIGSGSNDCYHVVLSVSDGTPFSTSPTILNGFTVQYGRATGSGSITVEGRTIDRTNGGGMHINVGMTRIDSCIFSVNTAASNAGGVYNTGTGNIINCQFNTNTTINNYFNGGGLYMGGGDGIVSHCSFYNNTGGENGWAHYGDGGAGLWFDAAEVNNSVFYNNTSNGLAGGICAVGSGHIKNCIFANNDASEGAGAMYSSTTGNIEDCIFLNNGNTAFINNAPISYILRCVFYNNTGGDGGAVSNESTSATFLNCLFAKNTATGKGGAFNNNANNTATLSNCTFANNMSVSTGGGINNANGNANSLILNNCIIWGNAGSAPVGIAGVATVSYSLVQGTTVYQGQGNINSNPLFVNGNSSSNPAGSDGIWLTGDDLLRLECNSPCIDAGDNSVVSPNSKDITGITNRITQGVVDMGAYELPSSVNISSNSATNELNCLTTSIVISATGGGTYSWNTGATTPYITVTTPGTYTVTITNSGCVVTLSKIITQNIVTPAVGVNAIPNAPLCPQQTQILAGTGAASYQWSNGIMDNTPFTPTDTTTYTVIGTASNGCTASASYTVYVAEMPTISIIGFNTLVCNFAGPGVTYQWIQGTSPIGGATSQTYTPIANGQYTVTVFTNNPVCSTPSNTITISNVGIEDNHFSSLLVYPNPTKDKLFIENLPIDCHLSLQSIIGGKILWENTNVNASSLTIDMQNLPTGVYLLSLEQKGQRFTQKVVKE